MPTPNLGYGNTAEASIDVFNRWLRSQPEYIKLIQSFGQSPDNVHLNDDQKQQVVRLAQSLGAVVDEGHNGQEVDDSGNFRAKGHALRNTLIVAGIAAAALATMGAAGVFGGAAGAGAGAGAGTGAGLAGIEGGAFGLSDAALAGLGTGAMGTVAVPSTLGAIGGLAGIEGGAYGLGDSALASLGTGAMGADSAAAGGGVWDAAGNFIGNSTVNGVADGAGGSALGSTLGKLGKYSGVLGAAGEGIGKAATAAGNNALDQEHLALIANGQNIQGQSAYENELMARAKEEAAQRSQAGKDVYRASYAMSPRVSPFDPVGAPKYSQQYLDTAKNLADQGAGTLSKAATYATANQPPLNPYTPIPPSNVQGATNTKPGAISTVGNILSPALTTAQKLLELWGHR